MEQMDRQIKMTQHTGQTQVFLADNETLTQDSTLSNPTYKDYTLSISGLDCPSCASRIEDSLNALPQVSKVNVDFSTNTLYLSTSDLNLAKSTIHAIEPQARLHFAPRFYKHRFYTRFHANATTTKGLCIFRICVYIHAYRDFWLMYGGVALDNFWGAECPLYLWDFGFFVSHRWKAYFLNMLNRVFWIFYAAIYKTDT